MKKIATILFTAILFFNCSFTNIPSKSIIVIDAAHGGKDLGATISKVQEKDITLSIAKKILELNKRKDIKIVLLRDKDELLTQEAKAKKIKELNPKIIISLHANYSKLDGNRSGMEFFVTKESKFYRSSLAQANRIKNIFYSDTKTNNSIQEKNFLLFNSAPCPAVAIELGYLSNTKEREYLNSKEGQIEIAQKLLSYFGK
jgi:N-acetylmuramoyl-L-alanine amidase